MAGLYKKRNRGSRNGKVRCRRPVVGLSTSASAFLTFGLMPLATAPAAQADQLDVILDPIINSLASIDPTLATDLSGLATSFDPTVVGDPLAASAPAADPTLADLFQQVFWLPFHSALQAWIASPLGMSIDNPINPFFAVDNFCGLICNGADG